MSAVFLYEVPREDWIHVKQDDVIGWICEGSGIFAWNDRRETCGDHTRQHPVPDNFRFETINLPVNQCRQYSAQAHILSFDTLG